MRFLYAIDFEFLIILWMKWVGYSECFVLKISLGSN